MTLKKIKGRYALVSKSNPKKVLRWFGMKKPTRKQISKEERRVNFFKHKLSYVKGYRRKGRKVQGYVRRSKK